MKRLTLLLACLLAACGGGGDPVETDELPRAHHGYVIRSAE